MKNGLLALLLLLCLSTSAQKIRFTDRSNIWTSAVNGTDRNPCTFTLSYGTDTIIAGQTYGHLVKSYFFQYMPGYMNYYAPQNYCVREDTIAGIIYYRDLYTGDTTDHVYFNYNLHAGDTIDFMTAAGTLARDSIAAVDSTIINGVYHKIYTLDARGGASMSCSFVEGAGSLSSPFTPFSDGCFEFSEVLTCFINRGNFPVMNFRAAYCSFSDTFSNAAGCATLAVSNQSNPSHEVTIRPNPATDYIDITSPSALDNTSSISVYDMTGRCVYDNKSAAQKSVVTINTSSWLTGIYVVQISDANGILKREKIAVIK